MFCAFRPSAARATRNWLLALGHCAAVCAKAAAVAPLHSADVSPDGSARLASVNGEMLARTKPFANGPNAMPRNCCSGDAAPQLACNRQGNTKASALSRKVLSADVTALAAP